MDVRCRQTLIVAFSIIDVSVQRDVTSLTVKLAEELKRSTSRPVASVTQRLVTPAVHHQSVVIHHTDSLLAQRIIHIDVRIFLIRRR